MVFEEHFDEGSQVRSVSLNRYQAGCIYCQRWGSRFTERASAVRQAQKHNAICHPDVIGETAPVSVVGRSLPNHG